MGIIEEEIPSYIKALKRIRELEFITEEQRKINKVLKENERCLRCNLRPASYCEKCYQELISMNAHLQYMNKRLKGRVKNLELKLKEAK